MSSGKVVVDDMSHSNDDEFYKTTNIRNSLEIGDAVKEIENGDVIVPKDQKVQIDMVSKLQKPTFVGLPDWPIPDKSPEKPV